MRIRSVNYEEVFPFYSKAAKERVSLKTSKETWWYGVVNENNEILGVAGLLKVKIGYRIKGVYVLPDYRNMGLGGQLTEHLIQFCENRFSLIEAFAYNPKYYEEKGFTRYGSLPNGAVKLRKKP